MEWINMLTCAGMKFDAGVPLIAITSVTSLGDCLGKPEEA